MDDHTTIQIGGFTVTTLQDGTFPCGPDLIPASASPEGARTFVSAGLPPRGPSLEPVNAFAIERAGRFWLVDAGFGDGQGPQFGRVPEALHALGRDPDDVQAIVLTHMHPDHIGGLLDPDGSPRFPNAVLFVPELELGFWSDARSPTRYPREPEASFDLARIVLSLHKDSIVPMPVGSELAPGLRLVPLPGHSPGHSGISIEDDGRKLLMWCDLVHCALLQLEHPGWAVKFDMDPASAVATRKRLLADLADGEIFVAGSHLTGIGTIHRRGESYAFRLVAGT